MITAKIEYVESGSSADRRGVDGERVSVHMSSTVRGEDRTPLDVTVHDFSSRGIRFASDVSFDVGARIRVGLGGAGVQLGEIVWRDGQAYGCVFAQPLSRQRMATAFGTADVIAGRIGTRTELVDYPEIFEKWPRKLRLLLALGAGGLAWVAVFVAGKQIIG